MIDFVMDFQTTIFNSLIVFYHSPLRINRLRLAFAFSAMLTAIVFICSPVRSSDLLVPSEYPTLQQAIDAANDGDRILIAPGIYSGMGFMRVSFEGKEITVQGASSETCIIDCQFMDRAFDFQCRENEFSVLSDVRIINGVDVCST